MVRVGIIGAGQLGLMLGMAGRELGVECVFLDPAENPPAASVGKVIRAQFDDAKGLAELAAATSVITYEFENVSVAALSELNEKTAVYPPVAALGEAQDRLNEKQLFAELDIPLPQYRTVDSEQDLRHAIRDIGLPLVLKTRRLGYDGKGQYLLKSVDDVEDALRTLPNKPLIAEQWVDFDREVSAIGVRDLDGNVAVYPLTENQHRNGILRNSRAPAGPAAMQELGNRHLQKLMTHLDYVGVMALEFFVVNNELLANEFAPRVHNSGHWTIEGAATSQFENHIRAISGMPLGATDAVSHVGMVNLIGAMPNSPDTLTEAGMHVHDYGKEPRSGRKLGHITLSDDDPEQRDQRLQKLEAMLAG
ncbi:5-(carboxyamino)imidazole ribonucleotide synthase [Woeseia oceani]|nr:5-(carboxyamino)imidazole ribonucleotide synthase [Woeseia oceani]